MSDTVIDFHAELYAPEALRRAAEAYGALVHVAIEDRGAYRRAILTPRTDAVPPTLREEFANFVLAASVASEAGRSGGA